MSKHTPGPWRYVSDHRRSIEARSEEGWWQQVAKTDRMSPANHADGHLIAAAPDLLEALLECVATLDSPKMHEADLDGYLRNAVSIKIELAKAAIAKAEGK